MEKKSKKELKQSLNFAQTLAKNPKLMADYFVESILYKATKIYIKEIEKKTIFENPNTTGEDFVYFLDIMNMIKNKSLNLKG
jgi:hypothetical protein